MVCLLDSTVEAVDHAVHPPSVQEKRWLQAWSCSYDQIVTKKIDREHQVQGMVKKKTIGWATSTVAQWSRTKVYPIGGNCYLRWGVYHLRWGVYHLRWGVYHRTVIFGFCFWLFSKDVLAIFNPIVGILTENIKINSLIDKRFKWPISTILSIIQLQDKTNKLKLKVYHIEN
jgi:hypothetical protein